MSVHDHYLSELARAQHREAVRQCDPAAIRDDLRRAGLTDPSAHYRFDPQQGFRLEHRWLVASFAPRMHDKVRRRCDDVGWVFTCPMGKVWQDVKRPKKGEPKRVGVERPLFGTYGFLRPKEAGNGDVRALERVDGLGGLVRRSITHEPVTVPMGEVERFQAAQDAGIFDATRDRPPKVSERDRVRANFMGTWVEGIVEMTTVDRVKVLLGLLGSIELPMDLVELVA